MKIGTGLLINLIKNCFQHKFNFRVSSKSQVTSGAFGCRVLQLIPHRTTPNKTEIISNFSQIQIHARLHITTLPSKPPNQIRTTRNFVPKIFAICGKQNNKNNKIINFLAKSVIGIANQKLCLANKRNLCLKIFEESSCLLPVMFSCVLLVIKILSSNSRLVSRSFQILFLEILNFEHCEKEIWKYFWESALKNDHANFRSCKFFLAEITRQFSSLFLWTFCYFLQTVCYFWPRNRQNLQS